MKSYLHFLLHLSGSLLLTFFPFISFCLVVVSFEYWLFFVARRSSCLPFSPRALEKRGLPCGSPPPSNLTHIKRPPNSRCVFRCCFEDISNMTLHSWATGRVDLVGDQMARIRVRGVQVGVWLSVSASVGGPWFVGSITPHSDTMGSGFGGLCFTTAPSLHAWLMASTAPSCQTCRRARQRTSQLHDADAPWCIISKAPLAPRAMRRRGASHEPGLSYLTTAPAPWCGVMPRVNCVIKTMIKQTTT